jgi:hypothetical protein
MRHRNDASVRKNKASGSGIPVGLVIRIPKKLRLANNRAVHSIGIESTGTRSPGVNNIEHLRSGARAPDLDPGPEPDTPNNSETLRQIILKATN